MEVTSNLLIVVRELLTSLFSQLFLTLSQRWIRTLLRFVACKPPCLPLHGLVHRAALTKFFPHLVVPLLPYACSHFCPIRYSLLHTLSQLSSCSGSYPFLNLSWQHLVAGMPLSIATWSTSLQMSASMLLLHLTRDSLLYWDHPRLPPTSSASYLQLCSLHLLRFYLLWHILWQKQRQAGQVILHRDFSQSEQRRSYSRRMSQRDLGMEVDKKQTV